MKLKSKQYMFTFKGGGWNTVWAKSLREAKKLAVDIYNSETLNVRTDSVHLATEEELKVAMSNFW
tara:strand:+ start:1941 stop:2135 length:195 start_codon:yes stop_codon:yes gene_type:complete